MKCDSIRSQEGKNHFVSSAGGHAQKCNNGPKGKVLRVKRGYNPNSSSMGSVVFALPVALLAITAGFGVVSGIIISALMKDAGKSNSKEEQASANAEASKDSVGPEGQ